MIAPMPTRFAFLLLITAALAGCGTTAYDPGPEPDAKTILTPQIDAMFPGSVLALGLASIPAVPLQVGAVDIGPVRRAPPLAPAGWMTCLRIEVKGERERRYYATFLKEKLLVFHRAALPPDACEKDRYTLLRAKKPGT